LMMLSICLVSALRGPTAHVRARPVVAEVGRPALVRAPFELSASAGDLVLALEGGRDWSDRMVIAADDGQSLGLVPKSSVEMAEAAEIVADFTAEAEGELTAAEGQTVWLLPVTAPEGWSEACSKEGGRGLVPTDYLRLLANPSAVPIASTPVDPSRWRPSLRVALDAISHLCQEVRRKTIPARRPRLRAATAEELERERDLHERELRQEYEDKAAALQVAYQLRKAVLIRRQLSRQQPPSAMVGPPPSPPPPPSPLPPRPPPATAQSSYYKFQPPARQRWSQDIMGRQPLPTPGWEVGGMDARKSLPDGLRERSEAAKGRERA